MRQIRFLAVCLLSLFAMAVFCKYETNILYARSTVSGVEISSLEGKAFREQCLNARLIRQIGKISDTSGKKPLSDIMAATMLMGDFYPEKVCTEASVLKHYKPALWKESQKVYHAIWDDLEYFPVQAGKVFYENSWMAPRGNRGERNHEGCDLFGEADCPGYYPVISMTDGTVEQVGWLPLGGYRIGVRSPGGGYFYYAHLDSYEREFRPGDAVRAGQILGFMGNTGYGPEGTRGQFSTHLHLGIYIKTKNDPELSVNPYWILRYVEIM